MRRRDLVNVILAAAIAVVAAALYLTRPSPQENAGHALTDLSRDDVREIGVLRPGETPLRFVKEAAGWRMQSPATAPAHPLRMQAILALIDVRSPLRLARADVDLARFGLDDPQVTLVLDDRRFAFGDDNPLEDERYVLAGEYVYLVPDALYLQLTQSAGFFIDNRLLPDSAAPVRIVYPDFELLRDGGRWQQLPAGALTPDQIEAVAAAWQSARAVTVRVGPADGPPVTVHAGNDASTTFRLAAAAPSVVLARPDFNVQYHLDAATAARLLLAPAAAPQ